MSRAIHPNHPKVRNPKFAAQVFDSLSRPVAWLHVARHLRSSADTLFERENPIATRHYDELRRIASLATVDNSQPENYDESKFPFPNFHVAYMLIAFALENLLKGIAIAKGSVTFSGQELPKSLITHDLHKLHKLAAPKATIAPHTLDSLSYMSEWRARYPIAVDVEKIWPMSDAGIPKIATFRWPDSHQEFLAYFDNLEAELRNLL